ncbi:MAG: glycosyltransferase family 4 protein [Dyadobacter fermentans]
MTTNSQNRTVLFYAPVGNLTKGFKNGGAEAGCRKTIEVLRKEGYNIVLLEKPTRSSDSKMDGFKFIFTLASVYFRAIKLLSAHRDGVFHVAGFYLNQVYFEWLLIQTARIMKVKSIYEIRNGGMIEAYNQGSGTYQWFMKGILTGASTVLCQGYEYVLFLKSAFGKKGVYYPNYIMDDFVQDNSDDRQADPVLRVVYFGRVVPDKNVEFIIAVCKQLASRNLDFSMDIIGGYEQAYHDFLQQQIKTHGLDPQRFVFHGRRDFHEIVPHLRKSHFFIFPSKEKREGHSNSLTEAMGCGVVPIVSTAGFNESIAGNRDFVVNDFDEALYAEKILKIWNTGNWKTRSDEVHRRVVDNYTESVVKTSLLGAYADLFGNPVKKDLILSR